MNDKPAKKNRDIWSCSSSSARSLRWIHVKPERRLRLAVRDTKKSSELAKSHKPGHGWEWPKNSLALKEAKAALTSA